MNTASLRPPPILKPSEQKCLEHERHYLWFLFSPKATSSAVVLTVRSPNQQHQLHLETR